MSETINLNLPLLEAAQSQKHVTHNEALRVLDTLVQMTVLDKDLATPPGSPTNGNRYIVAASPTGNWAGQTGKIATWIDNSWRFFSPDEGWIAWVADENKIYAYDGAAWIALPLSVSQIQNLLLLGVNTTADTTNRLSVTTPAVLFNNESGSIQTKLNKAAASNTASFLFQTGFSGRAELGLTGDDDFHFKVSSNGSSWSNSFFIKASSGEMEFEQPVALKQYSKNSLPSASTSGRLIYVHDATGGAIVAYCDGSNWRRVTDASVIN